MKIEFDSTRHVIVVDGVTISLDLLKTLAKPDSKRLYHLVREGDVVTIEAVADVFAKGVAS